MLFEAFDAAYSRSKHLTQRTAVLSKNFRSSLPDIQIVAPDRHVNVWTRHWWNIETTPA